MSKAARLFLFFVLALAVQAAIASSSITGFVTVKGPDAPVGPIANAFVNVTDLKFNKQVLAVAKTNAQGFFQVSGLAAGKYEVTFTAPGFLKGVLSPFQLKANQTVQVNAQLTPYLDGDEIEQRNEKDETSWTVHNPNNFPVSYIWVLRQHKATGTAIAYPGDNVLETGAKPHSEHIALYVDGVQVKERTSTCVPPPTIVSRLTGYVDGPGSTPLGGVEVDLIDSGGNTVSTAFTLGDGSYVFNNEDPGTYKLTYSLAGYVSASQNFNLTASGGQAPTIVLALVPPPPTATLNVTVTDPSGPVPSANVSVAYSDNESANGVTDGNGFISFSQQPVAIAGTITATANDGTGRTASITTSGLTAGTDAVSIQLPAIPKGAISGLVTDSVTSGPLGNVTVSVLDAHGNSVAFATTAADGSYTVGNLGLATYTVTFSLTGYQTASVGGVIVTSGGNTTESVSLVSNTVAITVIVLDGDTGQGWTGGGSTVIQYANGTQTTAPLTPGSQGTTVIPNQPRNVGATVTFTSSDGRMATQAFPNGFSIAQTVTLTLSVHPATFSGVVTDALTTTPIANASITVTDTTDNLVYTATSDSSGSFSIANIQPASVQYTVTAANYQSYTSNVQLQAAQTDAEAIQLEPAFATVTVTLIDGGTGLPLTAGSVRMNYDDGSVVGPVPIQPDGTVVFADQPVGIGAQISGFRADGVASATTTQGWAPGPNAITVTMSPELLPGDIAGNVHDAVNNSPIVGATVTATDVVTMKSQSTTTDAKGNFDIGGLSASKYSVAATAAGYQSATNGGVSVSYGQTTTSNFALTATGGGNTPATVIVQVLDNGHAASNAAVTIYYNDHTSSATMSTGLGGGVTFSNQKVSVSGSVQAVAGDGSGRTGTASFSGWLAGNNNITVNLPPPATGGTVTGQVFDATTGLALIGVNVQAVPTSGGTATNFTTSKTGTFSSALPIGLYNLTFTFPGYQTFSINGVGISGNQTTNVGAQKMAPNVQSQLATVLVTVLDSTTMKAVPNASVTIQYMPGVSGIPTLLTDVNGQVTFTNQPTGVQATVTASTSDGSTGSNNAKTGFAPGNNSIQVQVTPAATAQISGFVLDATTQKGILKTLVTVTDAKGNVIAQTNSNLDGSYAVNLAAGTYNVTFTAPGYQSQSDQLTAPTTFNAEMSTVSTFSADVTVTVVDAKGNPLSGASVGIGYADGSPSANGTTDSSGTVSLTAQPEGVFATITATTADKSLSASVTTTFVTGPNRVVLALVALPGTISGQVADATNGAVLPLATVTISDWTGTQVAVVQTDPSGNYTVHGLVAGSYSVNVSDGGYDSQTVTVPVSPGQTSVANVRLYPQTATVNLTVFGPSGDAFAGVQVKITYADGTIATGETLSDGTVTLNNQPAGLGATISCVDNSFTASLAVPSGFVVGDNTYTIHLQTPPTTVTGLVTDLATQAPVAGATVTIKDPGGAVLGTTTTAADGTYSIPNLRDDTVYCIVSAPNYITNQTTIPELFAGQTITQNVQLSGISSMAVTVLDTTGAPVAGAQVKITFPSGASTNVQTTDANGLATIGALPEGTACTINVQIIDPTSHKILQTVNLPITSLALGLNSATVTVQPVAPTTATMNIYVEDSNGAVAGATVTVKSQDGVISLTGTTDAKGNLVFTGLPVGESVVVTAVFGKEQGSAPDNLNPGPTSTDVLIG